MLASKLRDGGADLGPIRLVPLVLSMTKLHELLLDEAMAKKPPREVLIRCFELDYLASSDMLKQAIEMRALVALVDIEREADLAALAANPPILEELLTLRIVFCCAGTRETVLPKLPALLRERSQRVQLVALGLYLNDLDMPDKSCKDLFKRMRSRDTSYYSLVTRLHLASADVGRDGALALQELLMSQTCALRSLDLSSTKLDGFTLLQALRGNSSLTSLDVRLIPGISALYQSLGDTLLQEGAMCRLGFLRCDAFDVLEGEKVLSLKEKPLEAGASRLLAGLLKHNKVLTDVDLTATDMEKSEAVSFAAVLEFAESLQCLRLQHNPGLDAEAKGTIRVAADQYKPNLRLEL